LLFCPSAVAALFLLLSQLPILLFKLICLPLNGGGGAQGAVASAGQGGSSIIHPLTPYNTRASSSSSSSLSAFALSSSSSLKQSGAYQTSFLLD
jgi:hypothetical protein